MSQAAATPIEPVNATSTGTSPQAQPNEPHSGHTSPMEAKLLDVMNAVNKKYGGDPNEFSSLSKITQKVEAEAKEAPPAQKKEPVGTHAVGAVSKKEAPNAKDIAQEGLEAGGKEHEEGARQKDAQPLQEPALKPPQKEKLKVGDQELELDAEQIKRFAQKGVHYEKRAVDFQKREQAIAQKEAEVAQAAQRQELILKALSENPGQTLEELFGQEAFERLKPWAAQKVQKEMEFEQNPQLRQIEQERSARVAAEQQLHQIQAAQQEQAVAEQSRIEGQKFSEIIVQALQQEGVPRTDFAAAEMAGHMSRALARNIELNPQQLAQITREDNTIRVQAAANGYAQKIEECRKAGDQEGVVHWGTKAVELFGEPLMYAMAKYHLAKIQKQAPQQPKQILDAPKVNLEAPKRKSQYMTEDQAKEARKQIVARMERGEDVPENIWDTIGN